MWQYFLLYIIKLVCYNNKYLTFNLGGIIIVNKLKLLLLSIIIILFTSCSSNNSDLNINVEFEQTESISETTTTDEQEKEIGQTNKSINEYNISLNIDPFKHEVEGIQKVFFKNKTDNELDSIYFNTYLNAFKEGYENNVVFKNFEKKVFKYGKDYGYIDILNATQNSEDIEISLSGTVLCVKLDQPLKPGSSTEITLHYKAKIPKICHRTGYNESAMWLGNFIPTLAVVDNDGWYTNKYYPAGESFYSEIANYSVIVNVPKGFVAVGTGTPDYSEKDGNSIYSFKEKMVRDFALVISPKFNRIHKISETGVYINFYYYSPIKEPEKFLDAAIKSIDYLSQEIGTYPYSVLNIAETEFFLEGGMEYPEIIFIDSDYLKSTKTYDDIAHEIAHQWFYNIIGNNQFKYPWLDEAMSSFIQNYIFYDQNTIDTKMLNDYNNLNEKIENIEKSEISNDVSVYSSWSDYYNIQYLKANLMIYSLKLKMGDDKFKEFLKNYYIEYSFKIADTNDFINTAEKAYGKDLHNFFDKWLNQQNLPPLNDD